MRKELRDRDPAVLADAVIKGMQEKKANRITLVDLREIQNAVCDFFVICHGESDRQVGAIAGSVEDETLKLVGDKPWHKEGKDNAEWILLDYVNVVVHIFHREARDFYDLESLWADAKIKEIEYQV